MSQRDIETALVEMVQALTLMKQATLATERAAEALKRAHETTVQEGVEALPAPEAPISEHRRHHRPGVPCKIGTDPELEAFLRARIDRLTYPQLAEAVAAHFPKKRRVGKSAIHAWWKREKSADHPG